MVGTEPCGQCKCCEAGTRCARVLSLSPKDEQALRRIDAIIGSAPIMESPSFGRRAITQAKEPPEPTTSGLCRRCGVHFDLAIYLAEFLKTRGAPWPKCAACIQKERT